MPIAELLAGLALLLLVALAVELAELTARLRALPLRYRDRVAEAPAPRPIADRLGGVALAATMIWFLALPWAAASEHPAWALAFFLSLFVVGVGMLSRLRVATVRYPLATFGPLVVVAGAAAMT